MNNTLGYDVVRTLLDDVFYTKFSGEKFPGRATAETAALFHPDSMSQAALNLDLFGGVGNWEQTAEQQDLPENDPTFKNTKLFTAVKFAKAISISKEWFDDNNHNAYEQTIMNFANRAKTTRDKNAFTPFRNAFTTTLTADGVALVSDSHINNAGSTVDNKVTGTLSEVTLNNAMNQLAEMKSQDNEIDGWVGSILLVPIANFNNACIITKSTLKSGTANNDLNYFSDYWPGLQVMTSPYLGAAAGGSDAAWFLLSNEHAVTRWVREAVSTNLVDYTISTNDTYKYKGRFREVVGAMTYDGLVGSNGS